MIRRRFQRFEHRVTVLEAESGREAPMIESMQAAGPPRIFAGETAYQQEMLQERLGTATHGARRTAGV